MYYAESLYLSFRMNGIEKWLQELHWEHVRGESVSFSLTRQGMGMGMGERETHLKFLLLLYAWAAPKSSSSRSVAGTNGAEKLEMGSLSPSP